MGRSRTLSAAWEERGDGELRSELGSGTLTCFGLSGRAFKVIRQEHPYIAIALGLQLRGHELVMATSPCYQQKIESLGLGFRAVRPDSDWLSDRDKVRRFSHPRMGLLRVGRELLMPTLRESYEDTLAAAEGADLLVSMLATYATRLVAEKTGIPWASAVHIPLGFFSAYDLPVLPVAPVLSKKLRCLGPAGYCPHHSPSSLHPAPCCG